MKVVSKDEDTAHYNAVLRGGLLGGATGLATGLVGLTLAARRYPAVRSLTLPFRAFMVCSVGTFATIISADSASTKFAKARDPMNFYQDEASRQLDAAKTSRTASQKAVDWARENRYSIVGASWLASMAIAGVLVGRNKYLTTSQKWVQARVYAQGLTLAVLVASVSLETRDAQKGQGRWETVMVLDPDDPEHKHMIEKKIHKEEYSGQDLWQDMIATEERKLKSQHKDIHLRKKEQVVEAAQDAGEAVKDAVVDAKDAVKDKAQGAKARLKDETLR